MLRTSIVRALLVFLLASSVVSAQDAREIMRRSIEREHTNTEASLNYTFVQRQQEQEMDAAGTVKKTESETMDVTLLEGSPYRRVIARNDKPLSAKEQAKEEEKLQRSIRERRAESPQAKARRIEDWRRKQEKQREPLKEIPDAFDLKLIGSEMVAGVDTWVIYAEPHPGYRPRSSGAAFFPKVKGRCWITKRDYQWAKAEMETLDTISFGGFLVRMAKGSRLSYEAAFVNNEVWLPKRIAMRGSIRIALLKLLRGEVTFDFSNYRKFQADSRLITTER